MASQPASAQVPRFERTPDRALAELASRESGVRVAAVRKLASFRRNRRVAHHLIASLQTDPDREVRRGAAVALAKIGGRRAKQALILASICDPDAGTREGLAAYARRARHVRCHEHPLPSAVRVQLPRVEAKLLPYLHHPSRIARQHALRLLAQMHSQKARKTIWQMASTDPVWSIRIDALRVIANAYGKRSLTVARYCLTSDPDQRVRRVALAVLGHLGARQAVPWILASIRTETSAQLQRRGLEALTEIGNAAAARGLASIAAAHRREKTRIAAIESLTRLGRHKRQTRQALAKLLGAARSPAIRAAAMRALSGAKGKAVCRARARRIADPDAAVRLAVIDQLSGCPQSVVRPAVAKAARRDKSAKVRAAALRLLVKIASKRALQPQLAQILRRERSAELRRIALDALLALPVQKTAKLLAAVATGDADPALRRAAVKGLGKAPAQRAVPALTRTLDREAQAEVRLAAVRALAGYDDAAAYRALRAAADEDKDARVRKLAAAEAAKSPARRAWISGLLLATTDRSASRRLDAVRQLSELQVPRTYRALVRLLWVDHDARVRAAVARGFSGIDHPLIDLALSVAHAVDRDDSVIHAIERSQKHRVARLHKLLAQVRSGDAHTRRDALQQLQPSPMPPVRKLVLHTLLKDKDKSVRSAAAKALHRYRDKLASQQLALAAQHEKDAGVRKQILGLSGRLYARWRRARGRFSIERLLEQLHGSAPSARVAAATRLGILRNRKAFSALREATRADDAKLRYAAIVALAVFGDIKILPRSARLEKDTALRQKLIQLNYLRRAKSDQLAAALSSSKQSEVMRGIEAASITHVDAAVPYLVKLALVHLDRGVRKAAARALVLYDKPLARWAIRVASGHDASRKLRRTMWSLAVLAEGGGA